MGDGLTEYGLDVWVLADWVLGTGLTDPVPGLADYGLGDSVLDWLWPGCREASGIEDASVAVRHRPFSTDGHLNR